jgi:hypothetical protein
MALREFSARQNFVAIGEEPTSPDLLSVRQNGE